jgi:phenylalanyl-tRNA synthetase beta chain
MKISYNWLKRYIALDVSAEETAGILTSIGLEVEALERLPHEKLDYSSFIVGEVLSAEKHPNADRLRLTQVNIGHASPLGIVCGAPNVTAGQKVIVAPVGTTVLMKGDTVTLKKTEIRGQLSEGMICAEDEIGIGESHEGIMVLDPDAVPGTPLKEYLGIEEDYIFEIGLTPNRIDAASHFGVARDLAAYFQHRKPVLLEKPSVDAYQQDTDAMPYPIELLNPEACIRYSGVLVTGLKVTESPRWLQNALKSVGLKPINNIVDITNYVLHESGQPLHAFDAAKITGNKVVVRKASEGETFVTLDGTERKLSSDDLMICNTAKPMCIAGVFGGLDSGVTDATTSVFIESACFEPRHIRRTAKRHGLNTDASFRFERGSDPDITVYAMKRAAVLMKEIAGAVIEGDFTDIYPSPVKPVTTEVSFAGINNLIGKIIDKNITKDILRSLEINIVAEKDKSLLIEIPTYRNDVTREADVIEEILRIYGYNQVEISDKLHSNLSWRVKPDKEQIVNTLSDLLVANGFYEMMNNSLTNPSFYSEEERSDLVMLMNPLSSELSAMRKNMTFSGLESAAHNINRRAGDLKLFEFGYTYKNDPEKSNKYQLPYCETFELAMFITGNDGRENWLKKPATSGFYHIKAYAETILTRTGLTISKLNLKNGADTMFSECIDYYHDDKLIARAGTISRQILERFDIKQPVYHAIINAQLLIDETAAHKNRYHDIPKFPEVRRDLSMILPSPVTYNEIEKTAFSTEKKLLKSMNLFDVYTGQNIGEGKKSYAVSFHLYDENKTLTNEEIDACMSRLAGALEQKLHAIIRKS